MSDDKDTYEFTQAPISLRVEPGRVLIDIRPVNTFPMLAVFELEALDKLLRACMDAKLASGNQGEAGHERE